MADVSIMSMIAGFLPASSDPPPTHNPTATSTKPTGATSAGSSSTAGHGGAATRRRVVHMICFSKDRAFQLEQLLKSSKRHLRLVQEKTRESKGEGRERVQLCVSVLYVASAAPSPDAAPQTAAGVGAVAEDVVAAAGPEAAPSSSGSGRTMQESYDIVRRRHPDVRFVRERPGEFCGQLRSLVSEEMGDQAPGSTGDEHEGGEERFVLFAVDDMFFYRDFELPGALKLLATDPSIFCVHLRLHPGITWSHTSGAPCQVPHLSPNGREVEQSRSLAGHPGSSSSSSSSCREEANDDRRTPGDKVGGACEYDETREQQRHAILAADFGLLTFTREEGTGEWDYPWDLTGGLYRRGDAVAVVDGIVTTFGEQAAANPNLLEYHGHVLLQRKDNVQPTSTEIGSRSAETSGRANSRGAKASANVPPSSLLEPSCLGPSEETVAADPANTGGASSASSTPEKTQLPARRTDLDVAATSSAPPGTGAASVTGAALSAAVNAAKAAPRCGCSGTAVMSSIAVNRVQSTYSTPVYASQGGGTGDLNRRLRPRCGPLSPGAAIGAGAVGRRARDGLAAGEEGRREEDVQGGEAENGNAEAGGGGRGGLDGQAYRRRVFNSVHVGELWFDEDFATEGDGGAAAAEVTARRGSQAEAGSTNHGRSGDAEQRHSSHASTTVTVLLPVRNGGDHLVDAVDSVLSCAREMPSGWGVELLIVDDGSEDGAVERAVAAATHTDTTVFCSGRDLNGVRGRTGLGGGSGKERCTEAEEWVAECSDSAAGDASAVGGDAFASSRVVAHGVSGRSCPTLSETGRSQNRVTIGVLRHERSLGLAESLNEGLREARSDLVARMDADDVCMPDRLKQQVTFMLENPRVSVLGTSVATFSGKTTRESGNGTRAREHQPLRPRRDTTPGAVHLPVSGVQRITRHPTDPAFLEWSMLFSCCLAHPSVMLRRDRVVEVGGYDPTAEPAEDYDLWLRMQSSVPGCVANLGEVLLGLRKHEKNVSRQRRLEQGVAADAAAARAMTRLLAGHGPRGVVTPTQAAVSRLPETAASAGDLADAARLLGDLGAVAVATEAVGPGRAVGTGPRALATKVVACSPDANNICNAVGDLHQDGSGEHGCERQRRGRDMIARDIEARLGAMGVHAMSRFGAGAAPVLDEWTKRFPDRPLLFALGGGR